MKILMLSVFMSIAVCAVNVTVLNGKVSFSVDGKKEISAKKGDSFLLQEKQKICLLSKYEDGAIKIAYPTGFTIQLKKALDCEVVPIPVISIKVGFLEGIIATLFKSSEDTSSNANGGKGGDVDIITRDINLEEAKRTMNYLYFGNPKWTLPLKLEILGKGVEPIEIEYKDGGFFVPVNVLKVGQTLSVENIGKSGVKYMNSQVR